MDKPQLTVQIGGPAQMAAVEDELLQKGFSQVALDTDPRQLESKQYAKSEEGIGPDVRSPTSSVTLIWRD